MDIRHLRCFVAVADELHFGRAATRLQLSPAPVSRTVLELERELGVRLFVRSHHRVELTKAGAALLPEARRLLASWAAFTARGRVLGRGTGMRRIRIGSPSLAPSALADQVVSALGALHPGISVDMEFATSAELIAALRRRELDLAVALLPVGGSDLRVLPLVRYRFGVVVNDHDELAQRTEVDIEDLAGRRVLMTPSVQPAAVGPVVRWLAGAGAIIEELPDADLIRLAQLVRHGRGVTLSDTSGVTSQLFMQPGLTVLPIRGAGPLVELGLIWPADTEPSSPIHTLIPLMETLIQAGIRHI